MADGLAIAIGERHTTALAYPANDGCRIRATLVLAHGAGAGQASGFMVGFAEGLARRGLDVLTFNFLYTEEGRRLPDRTAALEACYRAAIEAARRYAPFEGNALVIGGKSMGGRIASHLAANDPTETRGVVLLGYPLHPPGKPAKGPALDIPAAPLTGLTVSLWRASRAQDRYAVPTQRVRSPSRKPHSGPSQLRVAHLRKIRVPMLFVQGARDPFGTPDELCPHLDGLAAPVTLHVVENGDHSLTPPKRGPLSVDQVHGQIQDVVAAWIGQLRQGMHS